MAVQAKSVGVLLRVQTSFHFNEALHDEICLLEPTVAAVGKCICSWQGWRKGLGSGGGHGQDARWQGGGQLAEGWREL